MKDLRAIRFVEGTKESHDYEGNLVNTFSYHELCRVRVPAIGIPAKQNNLIIIDVDVEGPTHKKDGREFWARFCEENSIPETYTVSTPSGGFHYYFRLPESVNPMTFSPPNELAPGVDLKWNGWVGSPPTKGYSVINGSHATIQVAPPTLMAYISTLIQGKGVKTFDVTDPTTTLNLHRPFTAAQLDDLRSKLEWMQVNATLSRSEWRDGIFALKAGIEDPALLEEMVDKWTMNRSYVPGDELVAREIAARASTHGGIGPGSIFALIRNVQVREGAPIVHTPWTTQEVIDRSKIQAKRMNDGTIKAEPSESNAAALIGAMFEPDDLYHDVRTDLYIFKGEPKSDVELVNKFLPIVQSPIFGLGFEKFKKSTVAGGLDVLMAQRQKDPHLDYLKSLEWDGVPRIERFFIEYVGAEDSEYTKIVGTNFWTSLAARGLKPGCKFDSMVVLEGHEGIAKSSLVEAIGGDYTFAPATKDALQNIDELRKMHQAVIVELPELLGLVGESSEKVKGFLAKPFDHIRALFARKAMKHLRGFVFVGTTNSSKYLAATMGLRRFWPIRIPKGKSINLARVRGDRDQLFAEGIVRFRDGHPFWHVPDHLLDTVVSTRIVEEPLMGSIANILPTFHQPTWTSTDIYKVLESQGLVTRGLTPAVVNRIDSALMRLGYQQEFDPKSGMPKWRAKNIVPEVFTSLDSFI